MSYKLTLPIYYTKHFKTKKDKTYLVGLNWFRNAHHFLQNEVKKHYHELVILLLMDFEDDRIGKYRIKYKLYYKNKASDMMNIVPMVDKFFNDALQEMGLIENDNVQFFGDCNIKVGGQDKENPRLEIEIEEIN